MDRLPRQKARRRLFRLALRALQLSPTQVALLIGYDPQYLLAVANGRAAFTDGLAFRLEAACGIPFLALEPAPDIPLPAAARQQLLDDLQTW